MRWTPGGSSSDVEDRRGEGGGGFGGGGGMRMGLGGFAVLLVLSLVFKKDFFSLIGAGAPSGDPAVSAPVQSTADEEQRKQFVTAVLNDAQDTWTKLLADRGKQYEHAKLVLFRDATQTACGVGDAAAGTFYCPGDNRIYIDLGFYDELRDRFGAAGDFAQAYVIAHELGHHIQRLLGTEAQVRRTQQMRPDQVNDLSVKMELQADCYAGVWGHSAQERAILDPGDVEEGLNAASSVGDDRIQAASGQGVHPEGFTHGTAAQRASWFKRGFESGRPEDCDTFGS
ncbi:MAG: KPN_02809 family neutral zinc metallopeptidase [Gemmatimonadales bacterium]